MKTQLLLAIAVLLIHPGGLSGQENLSIPVVVHIIWYHSEENISEEQVLSQIDALNRDFQARNDQSMVPPGFRSLIANTGIDFCLAGIDPQGKSSTGIVRKQTSVPQIASARTGGKRRICYDELGGSDAWDPQNYLNIWVGSFGGLWVGEASPPDAEPQTEDGIRIDPKYFGTLGTATPPYNLGHSLSHEIGHYLGLLHPWGSENSNTNCENDDGIADTPLQSKSYFGECPQGGYTCGSPDMTMNFMNWTDDACVGMFTEGQKFRMLEVLKNNRKELTTGDNLCRTTANQETSTLPSEELLLYPNPGSGFYQIRRKGKLAKLPAMLYAQTGKLIRVIAPEKEVIDLSGEAGGIYFLLAGSYHIKIVHLP